VDEMNNVFPEEKKIGQNHLYPFTPTYCNIIMKNETNLLTKLPDIAEIMGTG
jgi:hypothetical protein